MWGPGVFGKMITKFFTTGLPMIMKVTLFDMVSYPVKPCIYCLGTLFIDSIICNDEITLILCLYESGRLRMTNIIQSGTNWDCLCCIMSGVSTIYRVLKHLSVIPYNFLFTLDSSSFVFFRYFSLYFFNLFVYFDFPVHGFCCFFSSFFHTFQLVWVACLSFISFVFAMGCDTQKLIFC